VKNSELTGKMNGAIGRLVENAMRIALADFSAIPSLANILDRQKRGAELRAKKESEGLHVPPFLIASIVRACNLRCKGCYDRAKQTGDSGAGCGSVTGGKAPPELTTNDWNRIFSEARELGVAFILLAGGEPLLRKDLIRLCASFPEIIFPVFTNGLLIDDDWVSYFLSARNVIPVVSIEGDERMTDDRRGSGVYAVLMANLARLKAGKILFGSSITLTSENFDSVLSEKYIGDLVSRGSRVFFFVEYVPFDETTNALIVGDSQKAELPARLALLRKRYPAIFLDFPGDEAAFGGCLASGRGFVHINASGGVESCPFAPYSDASVATGTLADAVSSPTLARIRELQETLGHTGGCTLFDNRDKVEAMLAESAGAIR
jgi:MoaA/NifB/PqqE/SkfB family radical SAM enzyme